MGVDVEVGGKDQTYNILAGRTLVERYLKKEKWAVTTKLIEDPSGKKMGKTDGNIVNVQDFPEVKVEGIMSWPDTAIPMGFELLTSLPMEEVEVVRRLLEEGAVNPMHMKEALALRVTAELDGVEGARFGMEEFNRVIREKKEPTRLREVQAAAGQNIADLLIAAGLARSTEEAEMHLRSNSVYVDGKNVSRTFKWNRESGVLRIGKNSLRNQRRIVQE
jgi:tyrosyl-tRNA synthetase